MYENIKKYIRDIPNFPKPGIIFKDITPLLSNSEILSLVIDIFYNRFKDQKIDKIAVIESRGFLFGAPLALRLGCGLILLRKHGKLPYNSIQETYNLEYGSAALEIHTDALEKGEKILIIDDLLATGGTAEAACKLIKKLGGDIVAISFLIELPSYHGRERLSAYSDVVSFLQY